MTRDQIRRQVRETIAAVMDLRVDELPSPASAESIERWDSLGHFQLLDTLSARFGLTISDRDAVLLVDEDAIVSLIASGGGKRGDAC